MTSDRLRRGRNGGLGNRPKRVSEPETSAALIQDVLGRLGGTARVREHRVFEAYQGAVGDVLRARSAPRALRGTTLIVNVESSAIAHEVTMLKGEILAKMSAAVGTTDLVSDIRTKVGGLPLRT